MCSSDLTTLIDHAYYGRYLPSGHLVFIQMGTLFAARMDASGTRLIGAPVPVGVQVASDPSTGMGQFDVSNNGTVVFLGGKAQPHNWDLTRVSLAGAEKIVMKANSYFTPRFSPDGKRLALGMENPRGMDLMVYSMERDNLTRLTFSGPVNFLPVWSPDNAHIAFSSNQSGGNFTISWTRADGSGGPQILLVKSTTVKPSALSPDGKTLAVILQSATRQDGGTNAATRDHTRILFYDVSDLANPKLVREHVVVLPNFKDDQGRRRIAAQSELLALDANRFFLLSRDSNNGYGMKGSTSLYRKVDLIDTTGATDIANTDYDGAKPVAPGGKLADGVVAAKLSPFLDINDNAQLNRFGLHNGAPNDKNNLSEKWEAMGLVPALDPANPRDFFLIVGNDNDFMTQDGFQAGSSYKEESGADLDTRLLVYRITIPALAN